VPPDVGWLKQSSVPNARNNVGATSASHLSGHCIPVPATVAVAAITVISCIKLDFQE
jgi:hypothetical protein